MNDLDQTKLSRWLQDSVPGFDGLQSVAKFPGGQSNPTYRLDTPGGSYVLRRKPFGQLLPSAHAIDREYRLLCALHPVGFPVARPILLCEDADVIGAPFYLMAMVEGRTFWNGQLPEVSTTDRRALYEAMIDTLGELHTLDHTALGLADFGRPGNYFARQVQRWSKQYRASQTDDIPAVEKLIEWLPRTLPEQTRTSLIHGDYRMDNLIYASNAPQVMAVLDWELSTIGDPLADFTYLAMHWVMPADGRSGLHGLDLTREGLPSLDELVERYCNRTGRGELPDLHWYFAYNLFRLIGILQGVKKRLADGNASSANAQAATAKIEPLCQAAWEQARCAGA